MADADDGQSAAGDERQPRITVSIVSDAGASARVAAAVARHMPSQYCLRDGSTGEIVADELSAAYRPRSVGDPPVEHLFAVAGLPETSDVALYLAELPRLHYAQMVLAETDGKRAAVVYLPSLGVTTVWHRTVAVILEILDEILGIEPVKPQGATSAWLIPRRAPGRWRTVSRSSNDGQNRQLVASGPLSRLRLVSGMVRVNRPWRLVPTLSGALAAAIGASAFGVFYSSIWQMAAAMSPWRLAWITAAAIAAMSAWLIVPNELWESRRFRTKMTDRTIYNAATLGTVITGVLCMYILLFLVVLAAALTVIPASYLTAQIGHNASFDSYVNLAWLSTSLGTFAGAVGTGVADREEIMSATYGHRELQQRRYRARERAAEQ